MRNALQEHGPAFSQVVLLAAEVTWRNGKPELFRAPIDYVELKRGNRPVGVALRVGPYSGPFAPSDFAAGYLADLADRVLAEARAQGLSLSELQLDFDCASSRLAGYQLWVETIRARIAPIPLVITALPDWLRKPAFKPLARAAGSYVLQVHSLERPASFESTFTLCDPVLARRAVSLASGIGVPFRVALPTYGYVVAFNPAGRFIGLSAEGPMKAWPPDTRLKEIRSDPMELAQLVQNWSSNTPESMTGITWYRFPVPEDKLNWRWPTLSAMIAARIPRKSVRVDSRRVEPGLVEISLVNDGELDISSRLAVLSRWSGARFAAGDGLRWFELADRSLFSAKFDTGARPHRLPGW